MKKYLCLFLIISLFSGLGVADNINIPDKTIEYAGSGEDITVTCDRDSSSPLSNGGCPVASLKVCGDITTAEVHDPSTSSWTWENVKVPDDLTCSQGEQSPIKLINQNDDSVLKEGGSLEVVPKGDMDPHVAKNIFINFNHGKDTLRAFQLTDQTMEGIGDYGSYEDSGNIMIHQYRQVLPSQRVVYNAELLGSSLGNQLIDLTPFSASECDFLGCKTLTEPLSDSTAGNIKSQFTKSTEGLDKISSLHINGGNYQTDGAVIFGTYPEAYNQDGNRLQPSNSAYSADEELFFICREGAKMDSGFDSKGDVKQVIDVGVSSQDLKQCQPSTGTWKDVNECNDNLDNDEDGNIDNDDPDCDTGGLEDPDSCGFLGYNSNYKIELSYLSPSGDSCLSETLESFIYDSNGNLKQPETFRCDGKNAELKGGEAVPDGNQYDQFCTTSKADPHGGEVMAVEFFPTPDYFEDVYGETALENGIDISDEVPPPEFNADARYFVSEDGWQSGLQTLHQAEEMYANSNLHLKSTWDTKAMLNTAVYDSSPPYDDAWEIANTGYINQNIGDTSFQGGFHGKCETGETWTILSTGEWACSNAATAINVTFYDTSDKNSGKYIGIELRAEEAAKWEKMVGVPAVPSSGATNLRISARCWQGKAKDRPNDSDRLVGLSRTVVSDSPGGSPTVLAAQLPNNLNTGLDNNDYTCNFGFRQQVTDKSQLPPNDDVFDNTGDIVKNPLECDLSLNCYITAGSNSAAPVQVTTSSRVPSGDVESRLETAASNTFKLDNPDTLFGVFPEGGGLAGIEPRNPLEVCRDRHGCPPP